MPTWYTWLMQLVKLIPKESIPDMVRSVANLLGLKNPELLVKLVQIILGMTEAERQEFESHISWTPVAATNGEIYSDFLCDEDDCPCPDLPDCCKDVAQVIAELQAREVLR